MKSSDGVSRQVLVPRDNLEAGLKSFKTSGYVKSCSAKGVETDAVESGFMLKVLKTSPSQVLVDVAVSTLEGFDEVAAGGCKIQVPRGMGGEGGTMLLNLDGAVERIAGYEVSAQRIK